MDNYLNSYREMISLRGLTHHTVTSYSTYISAYLDYLSVFLCKDPQDVSWQELRDFIRWLQKARSLSDRTMNAVISQLRFFTIYVLHKTWDDSQLPRRRFDEYLPYVPSQKDTWTFISTIPDLKVKAFVTLLYSAGLRSCEVRNLKCPDIEHSNKRIFIRQAKTVPPDMPSFRIPHGIPSWNTGIPSRQGLAQGTGCSHSSGIKPGPSTMSISHIISLCMKNGWDGNTGSPAIPSGTLSVPTSMRMARICLPSKPCLDINPLLLPRSTSIWLLMVQPVP